MIIVDAPILLAVAAVLIALADLIWSLRRKP